MDQADWATGRFRGTRMATGIERPRRPNSPFSQAPRRGRLHLRPSIGLQALVQRMQENNLTSYVVTTADGKLVGVVLRAEAEPRLESR
jgi:hypothetical protein